MHLCFDARMAFSSGIGTYIRQLLPYLEKQFNLTLLVDPKNPLKASKTIPFAAPIYSIQEQLLYPKVIPPCDLFWSPHYNVPLRKISAKKRIVTIHDTCHLAYPPSFLHKGYAKWVLSQALKKSDYVFTVSDFSAQEIRRFFPKAPKIHAIHSAYDQELFHNQPTQKIAKPYFLFVGNLKPHKNLKLLLKAFDLLIQSQNLPHHLFLVGKQDQNTPFQQQTKVELLGTVPNEKLPELYANATAFVFPSLYEGFGFPPLEAMAMGCPTIVSHAACLPEVMKGASYFIDPHDITSLAKAMKRLALDSEYRTSLQEKGFERLKELSWEKTAQEYLSVLQHS